MSTRLADRFTDLLAASEPPLDLDTRAAIAQGRRLVLRRRLLSVTAGFGVLAVLAGGAVAVQAYRPAPHRGTPIAAEQAHVSGPLNILVIGSDKRESGPTAGVRGDGLLLVHVDAGMESVTGVSIPRDTKVTIPAWKGRAAAVGKINLAYNLGGAELTARTVSDLTGAKIDATVVVEFTGLRAITDAVGGVDVTVHKETHDSYRPWAVFRKGVNHLDGRAAEGYLRQRTGVPNAELDRVARQGEYLRGLLAKLTSAGTLANPVALARFTAAVSSAVTITGPLPLGELATALRGVQPRFVTLPGRFAHFANGETYIEPLPDRARVIFEALRNDTLDEYARAQPPSQRY